MAPKSQAAGSSLVPGSWDIRTKALRRRGAGGSENRRSRVPWFAHHEVCTRSAENGCELLAGRGGINPETITIVRAGGAERVFANRKIPYGENVGADAGLVFFYDVNRPCHGAAPTAGLGPGPPTVVDSIQREQAVAGRVDTLGQTDDEHETGVLIETNARVGACHLPVLSGAAFLCGSFVALERDNHFAGPEVDHPNFVRSRKTASGRWRQRNAGRLRRRGTGRSAGR